MCICDSQLRLPWRQARGLAQMAGLFLANLCSLKKQTPPDPGSNNFFNFLARRRRRTAEGARSNRSGGVRKVLGRDASSRPPPRRRAPSVGMLRDICRGRARADGAQGGRRRRRVGTAVARRHLRRRRQLQRPPRADRGQRGGGDRAVVVAALSASPTACPYCAGMGVPVLKMTASQWKCRRRCRKSRYRAADIERPCSVEYRQLQRPPQADRGQRGGGDRAVVVADCRIPQLHGP